VVVVNAAASDEANARTLAVRLAGPHRADRLLDEARTEVAAMVAEPAFRADVARLAGELLRRRELDGEAIRALLAESRPDF
jgi:hypothetical protein